MGTLTIHSEISRCTLTCSQETLKEGILNILMDINNYHWPIIGSTQIMNRASDANWTPVRL
jgi:hypothetical protein